MPTLSEKTVLITGASGFVGEHLCNRLQTEGATIHALSRQPAQGFDSKQHRHHWHQGDLTDPKTAASLLATTRPDIIFHLASYVSGSRDLSAVLPTFHNNLTSTVNLLTAATEVGCDRIVLAGSMEEPDAHAPIPCSPYAAAKHSSSLYAQFFHQLYQTPVVVARLFMIYGPAQKDVNKLIPYTIRTLLNGETPKLSSGDRQIDWIYVDDVVEGLLALAQTPDIEGQSFDIGSGQLTTIRSVIEQIVEIVDPLQQPLFGAVENRAMERIRKANLSPQLIWSPSVSLEHGLKKTVDWHCHQLAS